MEYKSQYGQDRWVIEEVFPGLKNGYFIDLAAGDGLFLSNTYVLEKEYEWNGICIEPNADSFKKLKINRNCSFDDSVVMNDGTTIDFIEYEMITDYEHLMSAVEGTSAFGAPIKSKTKKITKSLNTILDCHNAPNNINYISLDIEGSEIYVLQDFLPNNKREVLCWSIEINIGSPAESLIIDCMQRYNYEIQKRNGLNGRLGHDYLFLLKK